MLHHVFIAVMPVRLSCKVKLITTKRTLLFFTPSWYTKHGRLLLCCVQSSAIIRYDSLCCYKCYGLRCYIFRGFRAYHPVKSRNIATRVDWAAGHVQPMHFGFQRAMLRLMKMQ